MMDKDRALQSLREAVADWNRYVSEQFSRGGDTPRDGWRDYDETVADYHKDIAQRAEVFLFWNDERSAEPSQTASVELSARYCVQCHRGGRQVEILPHHSVCVECRDKNVAAFRDHGKV